MGEEQKSPADENSPHAAISETDDPKRLKTVLNGDPGFSTEPKSLVGQAAKPKTLGRYEVLGELGRGGMGVVYLATDTRLNRQVALKIPQFDKSTAEQMKKRFQREAETVAQLSHPNICQVFDVAEIDGSFVMVMELVSGKTLSTYTKLDNLLSEQQVVRLICKVAQTVEFAHQKGMIHRDLKPDNIMLCRHDPTRKAIEPKVMDFGLAKSFEAQVSELTKSGMIVGTPCYMAQEQWSARDSTLGPECDVYSLGVILYELLTGKLPFDVHTEEPATTWFVKLVTEQPTPPSRHQPGIDAALELIVMHSIAVNAKDRYASMAELAQALKHWLTGKTFSGQSEQSEQIGELDLKVVPEAMAIERGRWPPISRKLLVSSGGAAFVFLLAGWWFKMSWKNGSLEIGGGTAQSASGSKENTSTAELLEEVASVSAPRHESGHSSSVSGRLSPLETYSYVGKTAINMFFVRNPNVLVATVKVLDKSGEVRAYNYGVCYWQRGERAVKEIVRTKWDVRGACLDLSQKRLATVNGFVWANDVQIWDTLTKKQIGEISLPRKNGGWPVIAFREGYENQLLAVRGDGLLQCWDFAAGELVPIPKPEIPAVKADQNGKGICISHDGTTLYVGDHGGVIYGADISTGKRVKEFSGLNSLGTVSESSDGRFLMAVTDDQVIVWQISNQKPVFTLTAEAVCRRACLLSPEGQLAVIARDDGTITATEIGSGKQVLHFKAHDSVFTAATFVDARRLATAGVDGQIHVWDLASMTAQNAELAKLNQTHSTDSRINVTSDSPRQSE